jgi:hypothetical protein
MGTIVAIALVFAALVSIVVAKQAKSYGGLKAMTSRALKEDRSRLAAARKAVKQLSASADSEFKSARDRVATTEQEYSRRVQAAQIAIQRLTNPGAGERVRTLGPVFLYEHVLLIGATQHPLDGLSASVQLTSSSALLNVRLSNGQILMERFSTEWKTYGGPTYTTKHHGDVDIIESSQSKHREFSEEQVVELANAVTNQVLWHEDFVRNAPALIPKAQSELEVQRNNTAEVYAARTVLANLERESATKAALNQAAARLVAVEESYQLAAQSLK